jgi:coenzyme F420 hydrogenase subunit beta
MDGRWLQGRRDHVGLPGPGTLLVAKMSKNIRTVEDIARWHLCVGCGACAYFCPAETVSMVDDISRGLRPVIGDAGKCESCRACLDVCPAFEIDYSNHRDNPAAIRELADTFGPVLGIWEGHASDNEIRFSGSSGGILTALELYCIEMLGMYGVLHIGGSSNDPVLNVTRLSRTRAELLACTGSRYAPAATCDGLRKIEEAPARCVFVGQPAEVAALRKVENLRPELKKRVGLRLSFFCAGTPSTLGTIELLKKMGVSANEVSELRYRGRGWPGDFSVAVKSASADVRKMSYAESWGFLQKFRPYSIHLWPDDTGESADIACGDPWYRAVEKGEAGSSLVVARTPLGMEIVNGAIAAGYLHVSPAEAWKLSSSQENLVRKRRSVWGRRVAFKLFCLPVTRITGLPLAKLWLGLPIKEKLKSLFGTMRRIITRRYFAPAIIRS